ncbi:hypothetical protein DH96_02120 [Candidatus Phytoplasma oryzae]|uniref:Uncharacterized protein n=1 Tax=Candidatus Phytoplasma oryzae TaxID=203274 RepID=A0A328IKX0_9MOLU|nr:hypothetical protein [Candidatus Phytoplasma oryzae]RAM57717.1 hypothetical protein DH96_02120 [Candidatus Phytoplasma oryzae]
MQPKKSKFKKIFKWIILLLLFLIVVIIIIINFFPSKTEFVQIPIPEPKVSVTKQWQDPQGQSMITKKYTFYGLNGLGYYQKELEKEQQKEIKDQNSYEIIFLKHRFQTQKEPTDILPFVKQPFNKWRTDANQNAFCSTTFRPGVVVDSPLIRYIGFMRCEEATGVMWFYYDGPQYLLDEDKDYYIGKASLAYNPDNQLTDWKEYHLHFNPVRKTLSVYTEKFNVE